MIGRVEMEERYTELQILKSELEEDIIKIKLKIDEAKTKFYVTGIMSNSNWFYRAKYALEMKKLELKKVNAEFEQLKRKMKIQRKNENEISTRAFEREFMNISKIILTKDEYLKILNLTHESINKNNEAKKEQKNSAGIKWTREDEKYLEANYRNFTIEELALELNRSENSIRSKIKVIKRKSKGN